MTAVKIVFSYIAMFLVAGFMLWLLNPIVAVFRTLSVTGDVYTFANYVWYAIIPAVLILSVFWFFRKLKQWQVVR